MVGVEMKRVALLCFILQCGNASASVMQCSSVPLNRGYQHHKGDIYDRVYDDVAYSSGNSRNTGVVRMDAIGGISNTYSQPGVITVVHELPAMFQAKFEADKLNEDTVTVNLIPIKVKHKGKTQKLIGVAPWNDMAMSADLKGKLKKALFDIYDLGWRIQHIRPVLIENNRGLEHPAANVRKGLFSGLFPTFKRALVRNSGGLADKMLVLVDLINQQQEMPKGLVVEYIVKLSIDYSQQPYETIFELRRKFGVELLRREEKYGGVDFTSVLLDVKGNHAMIQQIMTGNVTEIDGLTVQIVGIKEGGL